MSCEEFPSSLDSIDSDLRAAPEPARSWHQAICLDNLPYSCFETAPFFEASSAQWALTKWLATAETKGVSVLSSKPLSSGMAQWFRSMPTTFLGLLPHGRFGSVTRQETARFRTQILDAQAHWPDLDIRSVATLYCVDGEKDRLPFLIYGKDLKEGNDFPQPRFEHLISLITRAVAPTDMVSGRILEKQTALGTILSELLKNTHQHARHGYDSTELDYSVRAVYARYFSADALQASLVTKDEKRLNALEQYIKRLTPQAAHQIKHGTKKLVSGFLEISILDSGPGLPQRWLGRSTAHDPIETEFDALLSCFKKGASSSNKRTKGFGLHNVLNTMIELGGFIRIRSNRLHVFRALDYEVGIRQDPDTGEVKQTFFDWHREFSDKVSAYGAINGSLVSLLIPLGHE